MKTLYVGKHHQKILKARAKTYNSMVYTNNELEGLKVLRSQSEIGAIICENGVSGNNGICFYKKVKRDKRLSEIPFILLVEAHSDQVFKEAHKIGIDDYFVIDTTNIQQLLRRANQLVLQRDRSSSNISKRHSVKYKFPLSKRIFDIVIASMALLLLSPLLLITILAIRLESKGKVYYIAKRVGRRTFDFYKLRSMRSGSDKLLKQLAKEKNQYNNSETQTGYNKEINCPRCSKLPAGDFCSPVKYDEDRKICDYWHLHQKRQDQERNSSFIKIIDDPRITKIGKIIRNTSIDELPQLINVIKGDMSLVGNRPLPVYEAELLTQDQMSKRFLAPAGITGLWQVELRGKGGDMSEEERIALDNRYADYFADNNYSLWYDLKILFKTVPALFQKSTV